MEVGEGAVIQKRDPLSTDPRGETPSLKKHLDRNPSIAQDVIAIRF
jgi:hypothetical protein